MSFIYLACPYTDKSELIQHKRYLQVAEVTAQLLCRDIFVYSPIVHCHELAKRFRLPGDFAFWKAYNYAMLGEASALHILELEGWNASKGLKAEIQFAIDKSIPIVRLPYPLGVK